MANVTFGNVLAVAPTYPALTDEIKGKLLEVWGELPAAEIGDRNVYQSASDLLTILPDPAYNADTRWQVAEAIDKLLERAGYPTASNTATQPPFTSKIHVTMDKSYGDMKLKELLEALAANPEDYDEIRPYLLALPNVVIAARKTNNLWVIPDEAGRLNVTATVSYVGKLQHTHYNKQRVFETSTRPTTLASAMGIDERSLIHPFTRRPIMGPDENGFDLSKLNPELHEALLWASITGHSAWPTQIDLYTFTEQILEPGLNRRWQRILDDYRHAKQSEDPSVRLISRFWPTGVSYETVLDLVAMFLGTTPSSAYADGTRQQEPDYESMVRAVSRGTRSVSGINKTITGGVYDRLDINGINLRIAGVFVLDKVDISGVEIQGSIAILAGTDVHESGIDCSHNTRVVTYKQIATALNLL